jgi:hypothetical protein
LIFKKIGLLALLLVSRLFVCAQTDIDNAVDADTTVEPKVVYKTFTPYTSLFQVAFGINMPVGSFGSKSTPFTDGYASTDLATIINAIYSQPVINNWSLVVGMKYMRNGLDDEALRTSYLKTYGDTLGTGNVIMYENLSLYGGMGYTYTKGRFMFTASAGVGMLYNLPLNRGNEGITFSVKHGANSTNSYNGGNYYAGKHFAAMGFLGTGIKILVNNDLYICADAQYTGSYIKFRYTEIDFATRTERDYLNKTIMYESIAFTIGLGAVFR